MERRFIIRFALSPRRCVRMQNQRDTGTGAGEVPGWPAAPPGLLAGAGGTWMPMRLGAMTGIGICPWMPSIVAVIVGVPALFPVRCPAASTVALIGSLDVHCACVVRSAVEPSLYCPIAVRGIVCPILTFGGLPTLVGAMIVMLSSVPPVLVSE